MGLAKPNAKSGNTSENQIQTNKEQELQDNQIDITGNSMNDQDKSLMKSDSMQISRRDENEEMNRNSTPNKNDSSIKMNDIQDFLKELSWDDRFHWIHQQKLKGNRFFQKGMFEEAADVFEYGLQGIEFDKVDPEKQRRMNQEEIIPMLINFITCLINLNKFKNANLICDKALERDPQNAKVISKKGECQVYCGNFDNAVVFLNKALKVAQNDTDRLNICHTYKKLKEIRNKKNQAYKSVFPSQEQELNQLLVQFGFQESDGQQHKINQEHSSGDSDSDENDSDSDVQKKYTEDAFGFQNAPPIRLTLKQKKAKLQQKRKILEYNEDFENLKAYVGPLSYIIYKPISLMKKLAISIGCKKRQKPNFDLERFNDTNRSNSQTENRNQTTDGNDFSDSDSQ